MKNNVKTPDAATGKTAMTALSEKLSDSAFAILMSGKPFGAVSLMVNDKPHFLGIMLWGEDKGNTFTSSLYDGDDDNIRDVWFDCVEKMHSLWFGKKVIEGKFSGYLDINYLPFSTQAEAWEYVNNIATIDEGYYDEFEFTIK